MDDKDATTDLGSESRVLDDRYELVELIGTGGMAEVWRARDRRLGRDVAVKLLSSAAVRDSSRRRRIEREARALATMNHPHIVAVYDYGESADASGTVLPYIVTELVEGGDLHRHLEAQGALPIEEAREILHAILSAIERAHAAGVVHGDLKPANVLMSDHGAKVGDFGVARILAEETGTTTVAATPTFAAPEVLRGDRPGPASDVYSVACVAFQMLTGQPPYAGNNAWEVASKHLEDPVPYPRHLRAEIPEDMEAAVRRGMHKNPKGRFGSATEFAEALARPAETVRVTAPVGSEAGPEPTEALTSPIDVRAAAFFGPFAGVAERLRARWRGQDPSMKRRGFLVAGALLGLLLLVLLLSTRGEDVRVPDVRGQSSTAAVAVLRQAQLKVSGVSFAPVTDGEPGRVLRTIPQAGQPVEPGTSVHIIATALAAPTPTPPPPAQVERREEEPGRGERNGNKNDARGRGKGDD